MTRHEILEYSLSFISYWRCHRDHLRHCVTNSESTQILSPLLYGVASPAEADLDSSSSQTPRVTDTKDLEQSTKNNNLNNHLYYKFQHSTQFIQKEHTCPCYKPEL